MFTVYPDGSMKGLIYLLYCLERPGGSQVELLPLLYYRSLLMQPELQALEETAVNSEKVSIINPL